MTTGKTHTAAGLILLFGFLAYIGADFVTRIQYVILGQLNFVAKLITLFFLNTYATINMTAGLEKLIRNPRFRPGFNVPWALSLIGGLACYAAMLLIHAGGTAIAVLVSYGIFFCSSASRSTSAGEIFAPDSGWRWCIRLWCTHHLPGIFPRRYGHRSGARAGEHQRQHRFVGLGR